MSLVSGLGRSLGGGNGYPLKYSCLKKCNGQRSWWVTDYGAVKYWTQLGTHTLALAFLSFLVVTPHGMQNPSSLTSDGTGIPAMEAKSSRRSPEKSPGGALGINSCGWVEGVVL